MDEQYTVNNEAALRKIIPHPPSIMSKRLQAELDQVCLEIIEHSKLYVLASSDKNQSIKLCSIQSLRVLNRTTILLSGEEMRSGGMADSSVSLYFLMPGVGHGLRLNGEVNDVKEGVLLNMRTAYLHCARAAARAGLWEKRISEQHDFSNISVETFLQHSASLFLKTKNSQGQVELSPRGDEPGFVSSVAPNTLFIPERPGNKVAVSLRNILQDDDVELLMFLPSGGFLMRVLGKASLCTRPEYREQASVNNNPPKLGILIHHCEYSIIASEVLEKLQKDIQCGELITPAVKSFSKAFSEHTNGTGLKGKLAHIIIDGVVKKDMRSLY
ncbi:pyridoxamine 5'-phosphate oxidase family protein [Pseudoteredinibacter isoporae]|uniref:pyridoxamine 5'-phosphate oxidase family protein n=1 Tax=Pseudoteredinibacter isoporae TaxID=570281 RepID=UPI00310A48BD